MVIRNGVQFGLNADLLDDKHAHDFGSAALEHAAVTLGGGSDPALSLTGQVLTLANVLTPSEHTAIGDGAPHHAAVTLDANADTLLALSTQALGLDTQVKNRVLAGPATGADAVPTFRALTVADVPDTINVRTVTDTTTETATDGLIVCDKITAMTVNLLAATGSGRAREIASIGVGVVTVDANGAETINGETTQALRQGDAMQIRDYVSGKWVIV